MCTDIDRIAELAKEDPQRQFFSIAHLITVGKLHVAFLGLRKEASAGIDGVTYKEYEKDVDENIRKLHQRLKEGKYQCQPLRRVYIPKENGKQRPISIPALEDKLVQKAVVELLNAIYEQDFLDCSYGFRPGRGQHQALDEVRRVLCTQPTEWILEIDIATYFDSIVRKQLMGMIEKRVNDGSVLRLIWKWIKVGVIESGRLLVSETGTGQGQPISPLLANIYLHYVLDEWFEKVVKPRLKGKAHEIRFADDAILCFQYKEDAEKVLSVLPKRFAKFGLTLHPEKTRLIEFGRFAEQNAKRQKGRKPATFDFLGLSHICARSRKGKFTVHVKTISKRLRRGLQAVAEWCREHRHEPVSEQVKTLNANPAEIMVSHGGLKRARNWKRWRQPKKAYSLPRSPLLGGHKDIYMTLRYVEVTQGDLQREYHRARQNAAHLHRLPTLPALPIKEIPSVGLPGIRQALEATRHLLEMYRRQLGDEKTRRKLQRLDKRLLTVGSQLQRIYTEKAGETLAS